MFVPIMPVAILLLVQDVACYADFRRRDLKQVPVSLIDTNETTVDLSYNLISRVEEKTFAGFHRLDTLHLSFNRIGFISDSAFNGTAIRRLFLKSNRLTALPRFAGIGSSLKELYTWINSIELLGREVFDGVTSLQVLDMDGNNLTSIHAEALTDCASTMRHMRFAYNSRLTSFPAEIFTGMRKLNKLDLRYVPLTTLPDFRFLPDENNLTTLWITDNTIGDLADDALYKLTKLSDLILSNISLTRVPNLSRQQGTLKELSLGDNKISDIPLTAFNNLPLNRLYLSGNKLTRLPNLRPVQSTLVYLSLENNNFRTVTCGDILEVVVDSPLLTGVVFSFTNITTFPDILQLNRSFTEISILNSSSMRCDCAMVWMTQLRNLGQVYTDLSASSRPCAEPPRLFGREWSTISDEDLCQDNDAVNCYLDKFLPTDTTLTQRLAHNCTAMTGLDGDDVTVAHSHVGTCIFPTTASSDKKEVRNGGKNILAAAMGGALGGGILILVIVVIVLVCRRRSASSWNQTRDSKKKEDSFAYFKVDDRAAT